MVDYFYFCYKVILIAKGYNMFEHHFQCPYCWETISMLLDSSVSKQTYVEDCEVCCNPIQVTLQFEASELIGFEVINIEQ